MISLQGAALSEDRRYRYRLWRIWNKNRPSICYIMLNPSTADENVDDATIRVCRGRAFRMGYGAMDIVNLFALRATDPNELYADPFPISHPEQPHRCTREILKTTWSADMAICAWGVHGRHLNRAEEILVQLRSYGVKPYALRINVDGSPAHPLRIRYDVQPVEI